MDYVLACPRDWRSPDATKSDFINQREEFYNYIPRNTLPGVTIVGVLPTDTSTKRCCRWQIVFHYVHAQQAGAFKFIKDALNMSTPRNARPEGLNMVPNQPNRFSITYMITCQHTKLDFSGIVDDTQGVRYFSF